MADEEDEYVLFDQAGLLDNRIKTYDTKTWRRKLIVTFFLCAGFLGLGLCIALPGPTLLDLKERTHTDMEHISTIFTGRSVGYLTGSVIGGFLFDKMNGQMLISMSLFLTSVATAAAPWSTDFNLLVALFGFQGLSMGTLDTGGNVVCVNLWGKRAAPYMQTLHFSFGMGAFIAPFIAEPFLSKIETTSNSSNLTNQPMTVPFSETVALTVTNLAADKAQPHAANMVKREENSNSPTSTMVTNPVSSGPMTVTKPKQTDGTNHGDAAGKNMQNAKVEEKNNGNPPPSKSTTTVTHITITTTVTPNMTTRHTTAPLTHPTTPPTYPTAASSNQSVNTSVDAADTPPKSSSVGKVIETVKHIITTMTRVQFAYLTVAILLFLISVGFLIMACCYARHAVSSHRNEEIMMDLVKKEPLSFRIQMLVLLFFFYFLYVGIEVAYGGLLMTFAVQQLHWTKARSTMLMSVFWGAFATGRGLAIFFSRCLTPTIMLITDLILTCGAISGLLLGVGHKDVIVWFCTAVLGIGLSSIFPTGITWTERYMKITGKATSVFVVGSALGEMTLPALVGYFFQRKSPMWLLYITMGASFVSLFLYIVMQNIAANRGERYTKLGSYERLSQKPRSTAIASEIGDTENIEMEGVPVTSHFNQTSRKKKVTFSLEENGGQSHLKRIKQRHGAKCD